jgi:hypothetical protein
LSDIGVYRPDQGRFAAGWLPKNAYPSYTNAQIARVLRPAPVQSKEFLLCAGAIV